MAVKLRAVFNCSPIFSSSRVLVGGTPLSVDKQNLKKGTHIVIGTTGRICQLIQEGFLVLNNIELFVMDEADKMMDTDFQKDIKLVCQRINCSFSFIFSSLPPSRQVAVFSATYPRSLDETLGKYMKDATLIRLNSGSSRKIHYHQFYR